MKIIEKDSYIEVLKDNNIYHYSKPNYVFYDYLNLIKTLINLDIYQIRVGIKSCNVVSNKKTLNKLKTFFSKNRVKFTGSYENKIYQYSIEILNDIEYKKFKEVMSK